MIVALIIGIINLLLSGAWIGTIVSDRYDGVRIKLQQYVWATICFLVGTYAIIVCIGKASNVS